MEKIKEMKKEISKTIRLTKQETTTLSEMAFELTKSAIVNGHHKLYKESDLVHFLIEHAAQYISIDRNGNLKFDSMQNHQTL